MATEHDTCAIVGLFRVEDTHPGASADVLRSTQGLGGEGFVSAAGEKKEKEFVWGGQLLWWTKTWAEIPGYVWALVRKSIFYDQNNTRVLNEQSKPRLFLLIEIGSVGFTTRAEQREAYARAG